MVALGLIGAYALLLVFTAPTFGIFAVAVVVLAGVAGGIIHLRNRRPARTA